VDPLKIRPVGSRLLVRCEPRPKKTAGGIHLPAEFTGMEKIGIRAGKVVRKGNPRDLSILPKKSPMRELQARLDEINIGDRVAFRAFLADANDLTRQADLRDKDGHTWSIIDVRDILGKVPDDVPIGELGVTASSGA